MSNIVSRRTVAAWAVWDWGSASFNAVVVTFVFAPYLTTGVAATEEAGSQALGWATAAAGLVIALVAPAAGTRADAGGRHRFWLGFHTFVVVACMAAMFFVKDSPEHLWLGLVLLSLGNVFFEFAEVSYNSILLSISTPTNVGRVSGIGWGMGYLGGLVLLVLVLVTVISPDVGLFGAVDEDGLRYRIVAVVAAAWFALFALPVLFLAPRSPVPTGHEDTAQAAARTRSGLIGSITLFLADYRHLILRIARLWREDRLTLRFLISSAIFRDGLAAIFAFAGVLAAGSYGLTPSEVIMLGVVANISAGIGAIAAGWVDDKLGSAAVIIVGLICLVAASIPITISDSPAVFWGSAVFMCLFVGPVQSSSRTYLARITPPEEAGENFGLYATTGRAVSFLGPVMFASFIALLGYQRAGALGIALVLLTGLLLFWSLTRAQSAERTPERSTN